jgi:hypothetical protein
VTDDIKETTRKVTFAHLDTFLKFAPIVGLALIVYLQSLFPSKAEFDKLHATLHDVEKQIILLTTLQTTVNNNTARIDVLSTKIQSLEILIVSLKNNP